MGITCAEEAVEVLVAANKYDLQRLKRLCEQHLVNSIEIENVIQLLYLSDIHQALELRRMCLNFCAAHFDVISKREELHKLKKSTLIELLQTK